MKRVIVTGGAGHLGSAISQGLAMRGLDVLSISSKHCVGVESVACELEDEAMLDKAIAGFGPIDSLVHCAGRARRHADLEMERGHFVEAVHSTVGIAFGCVRTAVRHMPAGGSIVLLASMWGLVSPTPAVYLGMKNDPSYPIPAAAGAMLAMTRHLAVTLAPKNIRVNAVVPGWFPRKSGPDNPAYMHEITSRVPMRRIGQADELVGPVFFLLGDGASYVTGQHVVVDGGYSVV